MSLYNSGSVNVVIGSANVKGNSTNFLTYVSQNNLFKINGDSAFYEVASVVNATNFTLTSRYADTNNQTARSENVASAGTATKIYSGTLTNTPLIQNYVTVTASERFTDNGAGVLTGNASPAGSGTVDYDSGLFSITLGTNLTGSVNLSASYYSGNTRNSMPYKIVTDFTENYNLPELGINDREFNSIYTKAMRLIDSSLNSIIEGDLINDTSPQLGSNLDMNGFSIQTVTPTEMTYLHGVTASIQAQIDAISVSDLVDDKSPQLGSNLDMNGFNIQTVTPTEMTYLHGVTASIQTQIDAISNDLINDTSPQLGSNLDVNGKSIISVGGGDIIITPDTTGDIILDGIKWPQSDGTADQVLKTNGSGQITWTTISTGGLGNVVEDTSPQLGSNLDMNGFNIQTVTPTEMTYLHGVTASIQTQIDNSNTNYIQYRVLDKDTDHTIDTGVGGELRIPEACTVLNVGAYVDTAGITGVTTVDINESGTSILSTKITIDSTEKSSKTALTAPVISDSSIAEDAILTFDIDGISSGTAGKGLVVWMKVRF